MRKILPFLLLMLAFTELAQAKTQTENRVTVKVREQKAVNKQLSIKFVEMVGDSRCPADMRCVWAGNAKIKVELSGKGKSQIVELNTGIKPQSVVYGGYEIKVIALEPRIRTNVRINPDSYTATFSITKSK
jgi:hypothetical protein